MQSTPIRQQEATAVAPVWPPPQGEWTYADWCKLPDDGYRYEVLTGVLYVSPPPSIRHQRISIALVGHLLDFLKLQPLGEVLTAPVGVRLAHQSVPLQPDIVFVRTERLGIVGEAYVEGTPDLLVEILSPSNWLYDRREKMQAYQEAGVAEYWIVDPRALTIEVYVLEESTYVLMGQYRIGEVAHSQVLPGFEVSVETIFPH
jgi:Uma2 family endonuclease